MKYHLDIHHRKSIRLQGYDYSSHGAYFVTICLKDHRCILGDVLNGEMILNDAGRMVQGTWQDLPQHNRNIVLDAFIVMPNHFHGILIIAGAGSQPALLPASNGAPVRHGLSEIVRQFKTFSAKCVNQMNKTSGVPFWQRNYYEHVIRDENDLNRVREYIVNNPAKWEEDEYYDHA